MKKILVILIIGFIFSGCVSLQKVSLPEDLAEEAVKVDEESFKEISESPDPSSELQNIKSEELAGYVEKKGIVFAKTDFQGLLEARYVKFLFENFLCYLCYL